MIWWGIIVLAIFLIGVTKSGFGSGVGLMIVPMTAISLGHTSLGSEAALGLLLPLLVAGDLLAVWQYRWMFGAIPVGPAESAQTRPGIAALRRLLPSTIVGVVLAALLLRWLHTQANLVGAFIRIEIGVESVGLVGLHWWRQSRGIQTHLLPEPWRSNVTGCFSAISSTMAHAAGPIVAMYLLPLRLDRRLYVGTTALYFFILNCCKLPAYAGADLFHKAPPSFSLRFLPIVAAGALFGVWLNRRMSDRVFTTFVYLVTFVLGWYVLYEGIALLGFQI